MQAPQFATEKYLSLESVRRNGQAVRTPVWFALAPSGRLYAYATADSFKVKRIRANSAVRIAPCDMRGGVTGAWLAAQATIIPAERPDFATAMQLLDRKYFPWKQILGLANRLFARKPRAMIEMQITEGHSP